MCSECDLQGDITIGTRTVIHPRARIIASAGPIYIGENNIIEEQVQIINKCVIKTFYYFLTLHNFYFLFFIVVGMMMM